MLHRVFNLRNIYSAVSFASLICATGAAESEMFVTAFVLIAIVGISAYFAMREDGIKNRSLHQPKHETYEK